MNSSLYIDQPPPCSVMSSLIGACSAYPAVGRDLTCGEESHQYQIYYILYLYQIYYILYFYIKYQMYVKVKQNSDGVGLK